MSALSAFSLPALCERACLRNRDEQDFRVDQSGLAAEDPWAAPIFADRRSERLSFASRPNDVPDGLQRFDTVGNDFEDCQEGHGKERAGNPPDRMPKEQ